MRYRGVDSLCDVGQDLLGAEHAVCVETGVAVGCGEGRERWVGVWMWVKDEGYFCGFFDGNLILFELRVSEVFAGKDSVSWKKNVYCLP